MSCAQHGDNETIAVCNGCGTALCQDCVRSDDGRLCGNCLVAHNNGVIRHFVLRLAGSALLLVFALGAVSNYPEAPFLLKLVAALTITFIPFGWRALSRVFSPGANPFSFFGFVNLMAHLVFAALIGWIIGPYQLFKGIDEVVRARKTNTEIQSS